MHHLSRIPLILFALVLIALGVVLIPSAQAQTFTVLHDFTGGQDGLAAGCRLNAGPGWKLLWNGLRWRCGLRHGL